MYIGTIAGRDQHKATLHYVRLLSITLIITWQLLLVSYNAKVIQLIYYNSSCKDVYSAYVDFCIGSSGVSHV